MFSCYRYTVNKDEYITRPWGHVYGFSISCQNVPQPAQIHTQGDAWLSLNDASPERERPRRNSKSYEKEHYSDRRTDGQTDGQNDRDANRSFRFMNADESRGPVAAGITFAVRISFPGAPAVSFTPPGLDVSNDM